MNSARWNEAFLIMILASVLIGNMAQREREHNIIKQVYKIQLKLDTYIEKAK